MSKGMDNIRFIISDKEDVLKGLSTGDQIKVEGYADKIVIGTVKEIYRKFLLIDFELYRECYSLQQLRNDVLEVKKKDNEDWITMKRIGVWSQQKPDSKYEIPQHLLRIIE